MTSSRRSRRQHGTRSLSSVPCWSWTGIAVDWGRRNLERIYASTQSNSALTTFLVTNSFSDVLHCVTADTDKKSSSPPPSINNSSLQSANSKSTQKKTQSFLGSQIMHQAIPYRTSSWISSSSNKIRLLPPPATADPATVAETVLQNAVVIFGRRGCCLSHVVNQLLLGHGVNPAVFEVEEGQKEVDVLNKLLKFREEKEGTKPQFPIVFVGGTMLGGLETVMAAHISGDLVPILKSAGALWL